MKKIGQGGLTIGMGALLLVAGLTGGAGFTRSTGGKAHTNETAKVVLTVANSGPITFQGLVNDSGTDVIGSPTDQITLSQGTLTAKQASTDGGGTFTPKPATCSGPVADAGTFSITQGTGAYATLTGGGTYKTAGTVTFPKTSGKCNYNVLPVKEKITITMKGTFQLG